MDLCMYGLYGAHKYHGLARQVSRFIIDSFSAYVTYRILDLWIKGRGKPSHTEEMAVPRRGVRRAFRTKLGSSPSR